MIFGKELFGKYAEQVYEILVHRCDLLRNRGNIFFYFFCIYMKSIYYS